MAIPANCDNKKRFAFRRHVLIAGVLVCVFCLWGYARWRIREIGTVAPFVSTGRIANVDAFVRTQSPDDDTLFIGFLGATVQRIEPQDAATIPVWPVYRFDPKKAIIESSSYDEWKNASGKINCRFFRQDIGGAPIKRDIETCLLSINGSLITTAGPFAIDADVSPDGNFLNVISANGKTSKGRMFPFWSGGGYPRGPYYHEVFERATGKKIGGTYTIKDPGGPLYLSFCWEARGKYVVYYDYGGRYLWVVPGQNLSTQSNARSP